VPDLKEGLRVCEKCSELYLDLNKQVRAAKEIQAMADAFKRLYSTSKNTDHSNQAIQLYHKAAEFYRQDGHVIISAQDELELFPKKNENSIFPIFLVLIGISHFGKDDIILI